MIKRTCAATCFCLAFACACQGQTLGQIDVGNGSGFTLTFPFTCNVDGIIFLTISACVGFAPTPLPAIITSNAPEHIQSGPTHGLPWDPGTFKGILRLGKGAANTPLNQCSSTVLNCWLTDVPIIIGSGMSIVGSGKMTGANFDTGTAIVPGSTFPKPLGAPGFTSSNLSCVTGVGGTLTGPYLVDVVEVNNLDTSTATNALPVPGLTLESSPLASITCSPAAQFIQVMPPPALGLGTTLPAKDYRVFATPLNGGAGTETLQAPGAGLTCGGGHNGTVDPNYACSLANNAQIGSIQTGGDPPNLVDLSNPLVVEIGPVGGMGTSAQNEGFWATLSKLTLALPSSATSNDPNVAFWNPSDQENSGLSFVGFTGLTAATTPQETGAWIYIGNHAPNSFVSNVQTDITPPAQPFYGMILDGRTGFGNATGTARVVYNSTFVPGRCMAGPGCNPDILAAALVTGANAVTDFLDDHFEVTTGDCIQVVDGASVSAQGNIHSCSPFIRLCSNSDSFCSGSPPAGADIAVHNITTKAGGKVVQDDVNNNLFLLTHVSDYSTTKNAASLQIGAGPATILPPASGTPTLTLPTSGGTIPSSATSPITLSMAGAVACPTCVTAVTGSAPISSSGGTTPAISITSPLPLAHGGTNSANGSVVVLASAVTASPPASNNVFLGIPGLFNPVESSVAAPVTVSGTVAAMYVNMSGTPSNVNTFHVRYGSPPADFSHDLTCSIDTSHTSCSMQGDGTQTISEGGTNMIDIEDVTGTGAGTSRNYFIALKITGAN